MRPINLIPADQRRNSKAPIRSGPIAYLLIGALALGLGAVTLMVLTNNKIADRKSEIAALQQREAAATAQAQQYAPFTSFASLQKSRHDTVQSLADSRFDWERVMRELSLIIPSTVSLTHLTATAGGGTDAASTSISSPSLNLTGCARGQDGVAGFISALRDIDGVTRVGLTSSERPEETAVSAGGTAADAAAGDAAAAGGGGDECATSDSVAKFDLTVAFDNAPAATGAAPTAPVAPPATGTPASTTTSTTPTTPAAPATDTGTPASTTP